MNSNKDSFDQTFLSKKRLTICIISPNFKEPSAWMISAYKTAMLLKEKYNVVVLTTQTKDSKEFEIIDGVKIHRMPCHYFSDPINMAYVPRLFKNCKEIIEKYDPDVFIVNKYLFHTSLCAFYLKKLDKKVFLQTDTFIGMIWFHPNWIVNFLTKTYTKTIGKIMFNKVDKVILLHDGLIEHAKKLGIKRFEVIYTPQDIGEMIKTTPAKDIINLKKGKISITYIGRLDKIKGYEIAFEVFEKLEKKYPRKYFFFAVVGDKYPELREKFAKKYPFIKFFGYRKDAINCIKAADIVMQPSYAEGLHNVIVEAMAVGTLVLSTPTGALPYFAKNMKEAVFIEINSDDIVEKVEKLTEKQRKAITTNALKTVKIKFDKKKILESYVDLIEKSDK